jgi:alpha-2-macroglobulin
LKLITQSQLTGDYDVALVTLALANVGAEDQARQYLQRLWRDASMSRGGIHWGGGWLNSRYYEDNSSAETTALAMMAVMKLTPTDPRLPLIMRWLMSERSYNHWNSTRDTAAVLYAATQYLSMSKETTPDYGYTLFDNGRVIGGGRMAKGDLFSPECEIVIRPRDVHKGANVIRLRKTGPGVLYYTIECVQYVERDQTLRTITGSGITISREYRKFIPRWNDSLRYNVLQPSDWTARSFTSGDVLQVRLIVNSPRQYQHILVEDYLPAGCEAFDRGRVEPWEWTYWWVDMDVRDERVSFYVDTLPAGRRVLEYQMRAWRPGSYHALAPLVQAMYEPTVKATGVEDEFEVRE